MRNLLAMGIVSVACLTALPAHAGHSALAGGPQAQNYTVEKGVKIYRGGLSAEELILSDQRRDRVRYNEQSRRERERDLFAQDQARKKAKNAYHRGYDEGFHDGIRAGEANCNSCNRRRIRLRQRIRTRPFVSPRVLGRRNLQ